MYYEHDTEKRTCATSISFDLIDGRIYNVKFTKGCPGNTFGVALLVEGMQAGEVIQRLKGVPCRGSSSCPNELAIAVERALEAEGSELSSPAPEPEDPQP